MTHIIHPSGAREAQKYDKQHALIIDLARETSSPVAYDTGHGARCPDDPVLKILASSISRRMVDTSIIESKKGTTRMITMWYWGSSVDEPLDPSTCPPQWRYCTSNTGDLLCQVNGEPRL